MMLLVLFLLGLASSVSAQYTFLVDACRGDSTALYAYQSEWKDSWVKLGDPVGIIPNGTEVTIAAGDTICNPAKFKSIRKDKEYEDRVIAVSYEGKKYLVAADDLMLSPNDTSGTVDFLNRTKSRHEKWPHWYYTYTPYILIFALLALATLLAALAGSSILCSALVPILLLATIFLEVFGVYWLGDDILWWVDKDHFTMGTVIIRLILFALALVMQIFSIRLYKNSLVDDATDELNVKRPIVSTLIGAGLLLACVLISLVFRKSLDSMQMLYIGLGLLGLSVLIGIIVTAVQNCRALGFVGGMAFTLFAIIYGIGFLVALTLLVIGVINAFMEMIVTIGGAIVVLMVMSKIVPSRSYTRSDGTVVEVFEDFHLRG